MSKSASRTCPSCGARLAPDADACDLCGTRVTAEASSGLPASSDRDAVPASAEHVPEPLAPDVPPAAPPTVSDGVHCNECGWRNPTGARFCTMCGARLQDVAGVMPGAVPATRPPTPAEPPPAAASPAPTREAAEETDERSLSRQVGIIIGAGVLLVVALFLVTAVSKDRPAPAPAVSAQPAAPSEALPATIDEASLPPLAPQLAERAAAFEDEIAQLSGEARLARQRELVSLFLDAGRLDRAAIEQKRIAEALDALDDWKRAGDLFYDWMRAREGQGERDPAIAQQAIDAYQKVLAVDPDNLDVRTDMATAYLSSNNPMQGVTEIKLVLDKDPDHLHARFNYGIMLTMIGRADEAIEQFEFVKGRVDEESRYFQQATEAIEAIRERGTL